MLNTPPTEYQTLHGATGPLGDAVAALPGYAAARLELERARGQLSAYLQSLPAPGHVTAAADVVALLAAGDPLPPTLPEDTWKAANAPEITRHLGHVFDQALQQIAAHRDRIIHEGADAIVSHLDRAVRECVDEARTLKLKGDTTAEEAIDAGVGAAWGRMRALRATYGEIRDAQATVTRVVYRPNGIDLRGFGFLRNFAEFVPDFDAQRGGRFMDTAFAAGTRPTRYPWLPAVPSMTHEDPIDDDDLRFAWLVRTPEAVPWVPTPAQLEDARQAALDALAATRPRPQRNPDVKFSRDLDQARNAHEAQQHATAGGGAHGGEPW